MTKSPIRVMCVDDHAFLAEGLKARLGQERDIELVAWLESAVNLVAEARRLQPHVVLLDIEMPGPDSFDVLKDLQRQAPDVRVIMFSAYIRDHYIDSAVAGGAWGYLSKSDSTESVVEAIRAVEKGEFRVSPKVRERMRATAARTDSPASRLDQLTPREKQVLRHIGRGLSRVEIATTMHRSPKTIDNHRASIMEKLDIHDTVELARFSLREGLAEL